MSEITSNDKLGEIENIRKMVVVFDSSIAEIWKMVDTIYRFQFRQWAIVALQNSKNEQNKCCINC